MSTSISSRMLLPARDTRMLLIKWIVALLVPLAVFTLWSGESIINAVIAPGSVGLNVPTDPVSRIQAAIFVTVFYASVIALAGYLVAADSGRRSIIELWTDIFIFTVVPLILIIFFGLIIGLALCAVVWPIYFYARGLLRKARHYVPPPPLESLEVINAEQRSVLMSRATAGGFWFGVAFALVSLITDLVFFFTGSLPPLLLIWALIRTLILPVAGYFLGRLAGVIALHRVLPAKENSNGGNDANRVRNPASKLQQLEALSTTRALEEAKDLVPNDLPLRSTGAQRFYLILLVAFVLFYPVLDPFLFGSGTDGRLAGYGDAGYYVILALGLNIVVGFAGLLDLGYVAFFAIGSYAWGMIGSNQFGILTGVHVNPQLWPWFFWPMLLGAALIAALWGVLLGAPTLRLRGDYLAIVTLGFGEIVPIVFLELDKYTNGTNGIVGVYPPAFPGADWTTSTPYYYLILALIVFTIFANVRLRDSRLGRAWVAIREDEIAASSSGINLVNTKLFAFAAGAFFSGIAGAYHAAKLGGVSPDNFSFGDSVIYLAMVVIGGIGSIPGVIVGALVVYSINQFILAQLDTIAADPSSFLHPVYAGITQFVPGFTFGNIRNLIFGIILVTIMIFRPEGLIPSARRRRELHHAEGELPEIGALDISPGAPGFEDEVRVE
ncbi:MAG: branched-chain amino acid ABC transporter permease [Chloroflexi bacterium]|nr:MAG: branched-chain amino acid ABC transporter permease [Chloroflexota bacterium]